MFDKLDRILEKFSVSVMALAMGAAKLAAFVNVVLRYLFKKLNLRNNADLPRFAIQNRWIET